MFLLRRWWCLTKADNFFKIVILDAFSESSSPLIVYEALMVLCLQIEAMMNPLWQLNTQSKSCRRFGQSHTHFAREIPTEIIASIPTMACILYRFLTHSDTLSEISFWRGRGKDNFWLIILFSSSLAALIRLSQFYLPYFSDILSGIPTLAEKLPLFRSGYRATIKSFRTVTWQVGIDQNYPKLI